MTYFNIWMKYWTNIFYQYWINYSGSPVKSGLFICFRYASNKCVGCVCYHFWGKKNKKERPPQKVKIRMTTKTVPASQDGDNNIQVMLTVSFDKILREHEQRKQQKSSHLMIKPKIHQHGVWKRVWITVSEADKQRKRLTSVWLASTPQLTSL